MFTAPVISSLKKNYIFRTSELCWSLIAACEPEVFQVSLHKGDLPVLWALRTLVLITTIKKHSCNLVTRPNAHGLRRPLSPAFLVRGQDWSTSF